MVRIHPRCLWVFNASVAQLADAIPWDGMLWYTGMRVRISPFAPFWSVNAHRHKLLWRDWWRDIKMASWWNAYTLGLEPSAREGLRVQVPPKLPIFNFNERAECCWTQRKPILEVTYVPFRGYASNRKIRNYCLKWLESRLDHQFYFVGRVCRAAPVTVLKTEGTLGYGDRHVTLPPI